jgi:chorismate mutase
LMCMHEIGVPGSLERVIRVLIHYNTDKSLREIHHVYLRRAVDLRPDWAYRPSGTAQP